MIEKPADHETYLLCHFIRTIGLYRPFKFLYGTTSNTVCLALGRCIITRHPANCRITGLYRTGHSLYRLYTNSNIGCSGTSDSFILRCSPVSRKTDSPLNDGYFNDYHRRYPDYHWQVTHKKDGYAVADEQKIIYFCYLINQNAILNLKKYGRRKDLP